MLTSCGPAVTEEEEEEVVTEEEEEEVAEEEEEEEEEEGPEMVRDSLGRLVEKPRYGGEVTLAYSSSPLYFDEILGHYAYAQPMGYATEGLVIGDWAKGPTGTGEASLNYYLFPTDNIITGSLAESWELVDSTTMLFNIRKGVHFHDKPPTNGRELNANDVVLSFERLWADTRNLFSSAVPWDTHMESITAPDQYTVIFKSKPGKLGLVFEFAAAQQKILPSEVIEAHEVIEWQDMIGTGAFIITDFVHDSSVTFERNPNYWKKDPFHPENTLPYLDGAKWLIIPDLSTRLAALRTAKVDWMGGISWEDAASLQETTPTLTYHSYPSGSNTAVFMKIYDQELPFQDKRVRRALNMAIDKQVIADTIYGGQADLLTIPVTPIPEFQDITVPFDDLPESTRELYQYDPEEARRLLVEAGYPDGFQTSMLIYAAYADLMAIVKDYWSDIGVDVDLQVKEYAAVVSLAAKSEWTEMLGWGMNGVAPWSFYSWDPKQYYNYARIDDPIINEVIDFSGANYFDAPAKKERYREFYSYVLDQAYVVDLPQPRTYVFWYPWIKAYSGETCEGYGFLNAFPRFAWVDQDMKEEMTGRR
jgi:peptide/nickel transport system substrate-binding protein